MASWKTLSGSWLAFFLMRWRAPYSVFSATDFLPSYMRLLVNLLRMRSPNFGSGRNSRLAAARRRDIDLSLLRPLGAVFGTALAAIGDALGVESAANYVIA